MERETIKAPSLFSSLDLSLSQVSSNLHLTTAAFPPQIPMAQGAIRGIARAAMLALLVFQADAAAREEGFTTLATEACWR